jgi:hypothetical protein
MPDWYVCICVHIYTCTDYLIPDDDMNLGQQGLIRFGHDDRHRCPEVHFIKLFLL